MKEIQYLVRSLGIGGNYQGYRYLIYAISLCLEDEDYLLGVSKLLYPEIAQTFHTTASSVERNLRTVVSVCWERGNRKLLERISLYPLSGKPTTGEFLDIVTSYLKQNTFIN
ncbi:MAG: sporulation initiation factor Spo0A C-terminal domain-containing protein [Eubacteriales bacterium]|nr:sporulation initiation factor Spo0A C-terminal domain-containing protein [Eubacteriales bacterium]